MDRFFWNSTETKFNILLKTSFFAPAETSGGLGVRNDNWVICLDLSLYCIGMKDVRRQRDHGFLLLENLHLIFYCLL